VILFGSAARGEMTRDSDLEVGLSIAAEAVEWASNQFTV
jgi:predicted nucleotidyltransferase